MTSPATKPSRPIRLRLLLGLVLAFAVIVFAALILVGTANEQNRTPAEVTRSRAIIERLNMLARHLQDAESGRRGYALTGDDRYRNELTNGFARAESVLDGLVELIREDPAVSDAGSTLVELARQLEANFEASIAARTGSRLDAAGQAILLEQGRELLASIGEQTARLTAHESARLEVQRAVQYEDLQGALGVAMLISLLGLVLFTILLALIARANRRRREAEAALQQTNRELEQRVAQRTAELRSVNEEVQRMNTDLERRVRERTARLADANEELEAFSYSVSHDLRAPLRHIHGYADMLQRATDGQLTEKARRFLQTIRNASLEMGQLIDDLLAYSRIGRTELGSRPVPLDALVQEVIQSLEMATKDRRINWKTTSLPVVLGDPTALRQVFANLIGNAVKYSRERDPAEIEIHCPGQEGEQVIVCVRDNGAGFDMQYAQKLFGVFQRLHRADEFEGSGVGLAIVRRVVARHGGRTWAESAPGQGASFYITLTPAGPEGGGGRS